MVKILGLGFRGCGFKSQIQQQLPSLTLRVQESVFSSMCEAKKEKDFLFIFKQKN